MPELPEVETTRRGLAPHLENLSEWAAHLYHQVLRRGQRTCDVRLRDLADEICELIGETPRTEVPAGPVVTMSLRTETGVLKLFSTSARLTTAADTALEGLGLDESDRTGGRPRGHAVA